MKGTLNYPAAGLDQKSSRIIKGMAWFLLCYTGMIEFLPETDVAVIGGGLAAMESALAAVHNNSSLRVTILSKKAVGLSGASLVSMSVHRFAPSEEGLRETYRQNFAASSQKIGEPVLREILIREGIAAVEKLETLGMPLEFKDLPGAGGKRYRHLGCCNPKMGQYLTKPLSRYVGGQKQISSFQDYAAFDLITDRGAARGVLAEKNGSFFALPARTVILATGGSGFVFGNTSATNDLTGDGYGLALRAGLPLRDMEFVQFYPYQIYSPGRCNIFPDVFEHGAVFLNELGERFMAEFPKKEQENRDILARKMYGQKEVFFDITSCDTEYLKRECSEIENLRKKHKAARFRVKPVAHFMMGGIPLRPDCGTDIAGLFCCGEVTGGLHGANRVAGSALTEAAVFGSRAGRAAALFAAGAEGQGPEKKKLKAWAEDRSKTFFPAPGKDDPGQIIAELRRVMWDKASIVRRESSLIEARESLAELKERLMRQSPASLRSWLEGVNLLSTAEAIVASALLRRESRGAHFREDYPAPGEDFDGSMVYQKGNAVFCPAANLERPENKAFVQ
ncbi:MAG: FAD-binding protein [Treponema sp.]|nr:FAD-binding protein [Treponema sp.]